MLVQPLLAFHNRDWLDRHQREERIDGVRIFREGGDSFVPRAGKRKAPPERILALGTVGRLTPAVELPFIA
jgi:hypothetical protein